MTHMKKFAILISMLLAFSLLAGCAGTPVVYECTCPTGAAPAPETQTPAPEATVPAPPAAEGSMKTGLAITASISDSASATAEKAGEGKYDLTMAAVVVDENGVIQQCILDGVAASVQFDTAGALVTDVTAPIQTKNELGANYGMVAYGGAVAEWDAQAAALAAFAVGKTVEELRSGAIDETGYAPEGTDLASSATIYLGGYVDVIEAAVNNAQFLGAQAGDVLKLAANVSAKDSKAAAAEEAGLAQLDATVMALTMNGDTITSCTMDSVQAKVNFDAAGAVTTDLTAPVLTKNQLGADYGMVAWGGAIAEWDAQAAAFCAYVTGKTPAEVAGIAVNEKTAPTEADLSSSVTIAIGGFQALVAKAAQ